MAWAWQPALAEAVRRLKAAGIEDAAREGMLLMRAAYAPPGEAPWPWERLYSAGFPPAVAGRFRELVERRLKREPVAYLLGRREFYGLELMVNPAVLIPRPETETLVEAVLATLPAGPLRLVDVGTGSGAVALALAARGPREWAVTAADVSPGALAVAQANAGRLGVRLAGWYQGDLVPPGCWHAVVANLPYVAEGERERLAPELAFEPAQALFGGGDGLAVIARLIKRLPEALTVPGWVFLEVAPAQVAAVNRLLAGAGLTPGPPRRDLAGRERVVWAERRT